MRLGRDAEAVARGARTVPDTEVILVRVEDVDEHWQSLHAADAIVFGTPTYIGSVAAGFKAFVEKLAGEVWLRRLWVNKVAAGFTVSAGRSGDKLNCLQQLVVFAAQMGMIWVGPTGIGPPVKPENPGINSDGSNLGLTATSSRDKGQLIDPGDLETARQFGARIATVTRRWRG